MGADGRWDSRQSAHWARWARSGTLGFGRRRRWRSIETEITGRKGLGSRQSGQGQVSPRLLTSQSYASHCKPVPGGERATQWAGGAERVAPAYVI